MTARYVGVGAIAVIVLSVTNGVPCTPGPP